MRTIATLAILSMACAGFSQDQLATPITEVKLDDGDSLVFLGDSITHQRLYTQYVEDFFLTRFPNKRIRFHNAGVGGAKAWDALQRFERDVAAYKPKYVSVLLGMNDGRYQPYNEEIFQTYQRDMTALIGRIRDIGATPILMTPTMFDGRAARVRNRWPDATESLYNSVLAYYGSWLRDEATRQGLGFVDMFSPLNELTLQRRRAEPDFTIIRDAIHPDAPGQVVMAYAMIDHFGLRKGMSNIRILLDGNKPRVVGAGGTVSNAQFEDDEVRFTWTANSLPWILPAEADLGVELTKLGHRASREGFEAHGLADGTYELLINDISVGTFPRDRLERHVELQANEKTPQYQQALAVAQLNRDRNTGPVKALRDEWRTFQQWARVNADVTDDSTSTEKTQQRDKLAKRLEGREERIVAAETAAREIEDRIFEINQPKPAQYVLRRVTRKESQP